MIFFHKKSLFSFFSTGILLDGIKTGSTKEDLITILGKPINYMEQRKNKEILSLSHNLCKYLFLR
ncbi:Uncharacterised protein [Canicola haemoglobinophilus]|uniref:Uncharacterized protein n=1 Tax=Canicola haemoglobinophilus TaxID=733 RepID=A0A377HT51_9PAST|nr:Uncharacterised protein [Canicola haemoglobinophilus]